MFSESKTILNANNIPPVAIDFMSHTHYEEIVLATIKQRLPK